MRPRQFHGWVLLLLVGCLLSATSRTGLAQDQGVLLGFANDQKTLIQGNIPVGYSQRLRTYWFVAERDSVRLVTQLKGLIVPRDSAFWRVNHKRSVYNNVSEDFLWAARMGREDKVEIPGIEAEEGERCRELNSHLKVLLASSKYLSIRERGDGFCRGNAHPSFWITYHWVPFDPIAIQDDLYRVHVRPSEALGNDVYQTVLMESRTMWEQYDGRGRMALDSIPDLYMERREGQWAFKGRFGWAFEAARGAQVFFPVTTTPPSTLTGHDRLAVPWDSVEARVPRARDAFSSPRGDLLGVLKWNEVLFFDIENGQIGTTPIGAHDVPDDAQLVMIQWALGRYAARWTKALEEVSIPSWVSEFLFNEWAGE